jgi:hypothetical protein
MPPAFITASMHSRHHRVVRAAQQHAISRHEPHFAHQHVRDPIGLRQQLEVGAPAVVAAERNPAPVPGCDPVVEQNASASSSARVSQLRKIEAELRPLRLGRQVVAGECVDVGGLDHAIRASSCKDTGSNSSGPGAGAALESGAIPMKEGDGRNTQVAAGRTRRRGALALAGDARRALAQDKPEAAPGTIPNEAVKKEKLPQCNITPSGR